MLCRPCSRDALKAWNDAADKDSLPTIPELVSGVCPSCGYRDLRRAVVTAKVGPGQVRIPVCDARRALEMARWLWFDRNLYVEVGEMPRERLQRSHEEGVLASALETIFDARDRDGQPTPISLEALQVFLGTTGRICPLPGAWVKFHKLLGEGAPNPMILGGWDSPASHKIRALSDQLKFAEERGLLPVADGFLRGLKNEEWLWDAEARPPQRHLIID